MGNVLTHIVLEPAGGFLGTDYAYLLRSSMMPIGICFFKELPD
jgi:hypothetical protein